MASEIHNVLAAALKALLPGAPAGPWHQGGPKPVLHNPTYVELARWVGRQVAPVVPAGEQARFRELAALAERPLDKADERRLLALLVDGSNNPGVPKGTSPALAVAHGVALEALDAHRISSCGKGSRAAAAAAAQLLGTGFLPLLDRELLRLDAVTVMQRQRLVPASPVTETLWRGTTGLKTTHWIVRLEGGDYAIVSKTRGRWVYSAGPRDDVIATVPDAQMQSAVDAILGGPPADRPPETSRVRAVLQAERPSATIEAGFSADGSKGFLLGSEGIHVLDARAGQPFGEIPLAGRGLAVSASGRGVLVREPELLVWDGQLGRRLGEAVDGALFLGERVVSWTGETITFHDGPRPTSVAAPKGQTLFARGERLYACGDGAGLVLNASGKVLERLSLEGDHHAVSADGRIASWTQGEKQRSVTVHGGPKLLCEKGRITRVAFAGERVLVACHGGKRACSFGPDGSLRHGFDGRELGEVVDELIPLECGAFFGFAPWERGVALVVDPDARALGSFKLGQFYKGGRSAFAQSGDRILFAHSHRDLRNAVLLLAV